MLSLSMLLNKYISSLRRGWVPQPLMQPHRGRRGLYLVDAVCQSDSKIYHSSFSSYMFTEILIFAIITKGEKRFAQVNLLPIRKR